MEDTPLYGSLRLSASRTDTVLDLPLVAEQSSHQVLPAYETGEGPLWDRIRLVGPVPLGRAFLHGSMNRNYEVRRPLLPGETLDFSVEANTGNVHRVGFERAEGRSNCLLAVDIGNFEKATGFYP